MTDENSRAGIGCTCGLGESLAKTREELAIAREDAREARGPRCERCGHPEHAHTNVPGCRRGCEHLYCSCPELRLYEPPTVRKITRDDAIGYLRAMESGDLSESLAVLRAIGTDAFVRLLASREDYSAALALYEHMRDREKR